LNAMRPYNAGPLKDVVLESGYQLHQTEYGVGVSYADLRGLDRALLRAVVFKPARLKGEEIAFLRLQLDDRQQDLAEMFGVKTETISNWERNVHSIPVAEDALIRIYVASKFAPIFRKDKRSLLVPHFTKLALQEGSCQYVGSNSGSGWEFVATLSRSEQFRFQVRVAHTSAISKWFGDLSATKPISKMTLRVKLKEFDATAQTKDVSKDDLQNELFQMPSSPKHVIETVKRLSEASVNEINDDFSFDGYPSSKHEAHCYVQPSPNLM